MSQLPKIVRDRLAGAPAAAVHSSHPDADLLTAFVEGGISEREREQLLSHLATCADCRDVVALSTPEFVARPELQAAAARAPQKRWWNMSALRWASVSATAIIVLAAALLIRPTPKSHSGYVGTRMTSDAGMPELLAKAEKQAQSNATKKTADQKSAPASSALTSLMEKNELRDKSEAKQLPAPRPQLTARENAPSVPRTNVAVMAKRADTSADAESGASNKAGHASGAVVGGIAGGVYRATPAAAAPSKMVAAAKEPAANLDQTQLQSQTAEVVSNQVVDVGNQKKDELKLSDQVTPAHPPAASAPKQAAGAGGGVGGGVGGASRLAATGARSAVEVMATPTSIPKAKLPLYRWTIDNSGKLERSVDGKNWEVVPVADGAKLQSLAVVEKEIWTGGAVGLLYHSDDDGNRWTRVRPAIGDTVLEDDITRITVPSPQAVSLTTASGDLWTSSDGGKTWRKQ